MNKAKTIVLGIVAAVFLAAAPCCAGNPDNPPGGTQPVSVKNEGSVDKGSEANKQNLQQKGKAGEEKKEKKEVVTTDKLQSELGQCVKKTDVYMIGGILAIFSLLLFGLDCYLVQSGFKKLKEDYKAKLKSTKDEARDEFNDLSAEQKKIENRIKDLEKELSNYRQNYHCMESSFSAGMREPMETEAERQQREARERQEREERQKKEEERKRQEEIRKAKQDFCDAYNRLCLLNSQEKFQTRKNFFAYFSVKGASFDAANATFKSEQLDRAAYYICRLPNNQLAVVPNDKSYEQEFHERRGGKIFFDSNFHGFENYSKISVSEPAIFDSDFNLISKGKLMLM